MTTPASGSSTTDAFVGRNLVVCCDGTGNIWGNQRDTNVVRLVRACQKDDKQIIYYDPGVGTASQYPSIGPVETVKIWADRLWGLAFGGGIYDDIGSAYAFLIRHYRPDDRIWVFGFSRGAFVARAVAGMVNLFGVVRPAGEVMIPTLLRVYFSNRQETNQQAKTRKNLADDIRANFTDPVGHEARVWFTGVWDTVASVGGLRSVHITSPLGTAGKRFDHIRHAVSLAEDRASYEVRKYPDVNRDQPGNVTDAEGNVNYKPGLKQLYFPGVHSDVGGSYVERGLSDCALLWMLQEAKGEGLRLREDYEAGIKPNPLATAHDQVNEGYFGCLWAMAGLRRRSPVPPALWHESLETRLRAGLAEGVNPPPLMARAPLRVSLGIVALLLVMLWVMTAGLNPSHGSSAFNLAMLQVSAAFGTAGDRLSNTYRVDGLGAVLALDVILIVAYLYVACLISGRCVRRLRHWKEDNESAHRKLRWWGQIPLLVAPVADLMENALTWAYVMHADGWTQMPRALVGTMLTLSSGAKFGALACLIALVLFAASKSPAGERPGTLRRESRTAPDSLSQP